MDATWVRLVAWHALRPTRSLTVGHTRCGRAFVIPSPTAPELPLGERSCESCLRLLAWDEEQGTLDETADMGTD
jgi:hypothetical protein